jgi:restriction endonuclease S subunit
MTYNKDERFALNHHAGFFKTKEQAKHLIIPEFFAIFYQTQLQDIAVSSDEKTLTIDMIYSMDFDVPQYDVQKSIMSKIRPLLAIRQPVGDTLERINHIKSRVLSKKYENYQAMDISISKVLDCMNGNTGLTEEAIYQTILLEGNRYMVLSSSTEERTKLGAVPIFSIEGKTIDVFEGKQGILVIRNGKAGTTVFLAKGKYTINDHAYILSLKDDLQHKISLKWIMIQYRHRFLEYSSSADNGTWNMTGFFDNVRIDIPSFEEQIGVVKQYDRLDNLEEKLKAVNSRISSLLRKQLV